MRALRADVVTTRLNDGRPEALRGLDIQTPVIRFEGQLPGVSARAIPLSAKKANSVAFRNDSSFPMLIVVRDAQDQIIQTITVATSSDVLAPLSALGRVIQFVNSDPSLARVTALIF